MGAAAPPVEAAAAGVTPAGAAAAAAGVNSDLTAVSCWLHPSRADSKDNVDNICNHICNDSH